MAEFDGWLQILLVFASFTSAYLLIRSNWKKVDYSNWTFTGSLLSFTVGRGVEAFGIFSPYTLSVIEWADLIAITLVLSGLFLKIRMSKPAYSRYPLVLIFLPLLVLLVYPLILDAEVIKSLLFMTFLGGAVIVGLMITITQHITTHKQPVRLTGMGMLAVSYITYVLYESVNDTDMLVIYQILLAAGMITTALSIYKMDTKPIQTT